MTELVKLLPCRACGKYEAATKYIRDGLQLFCRCGATAGPQYHGPNNDTQARCNAAWNRLMSLSPREAVLDHEVPFLLDRLDDFANNLEAAAEVNEWQGHVAPAIARLRTALSAPAVSQDGEK